MGSPDERLTRLEESQAFAEHTVEQLNAELAEVNRRLAAAQRRIDRLEERLGRIAAPVISPEASEAEPGPPEPLDD